MQFRPGALMLAGDAYHNPNDAFEGVGEALRTGWADAEQCAIGGVIQLAGIAGQHLFRVVELDQPGQLLAREDHWNSIGCRGLRARDA